MPSNRDNPNAVPTQRYPSGVCAMERMEPLTKPSRIFQAVCAYWLTSSAEFSANVQGVAISRPANIALASLPFTVRIRISPLVVIVAGDASLMQRPFSFETVRIPVAPEVARMPLRPEPSIQFRCPPRPHSGYRIALQSVSRAPEFLAGPSARPSHLPAVCAGQCLFHRRESAG